MKIERTKHKGGYSAHIMRTYKEAIKHCKSNGTCSDTYREVYCPYKFSHNGKCINQAEDTNCPYMLCRRFLEERTGKRLFDMKTPDLSNVKTEDWEAAYLARLEERGLVDPMYVTLIELQSVVKK